MRAVFTRESTRVEQQERLDMVIAADGAGLARQRSPDMSQNATNTGDEASAAKPHRRRSASSLDKLTPLKADGRIVLNLHPDDHSR